jgi:hypothetical protein
MPSSAKEQAFITKLNNGCCHITIDKYYVSFNTKPK